MNKEVLDIVIGRDFYPCKIKKEEGEILKKAFKVDEDFLLSRKERDHLVDLEFRYIYEEEDTKYTLIEEYLFKENALVLDIHCAVGVNYYLNKIEDSK